MAKGFMSGGVDFDDLFDPDTTGDGPQAPWLMSGGTALKYAALSYGAKRADVGFVSSAGVDVSNLWAAKGTAVYFPSTITAASHSLSGLARTASVSISVLTSGVIRVATGGTTSSSGGGDYRYGASSAGLDFRMFGTALGWRNPNGSSGTLTGKGGVSFTAATPHNSAAFDTGWISAADNATPFLSFAATSVANGGQTVVEANPFTIQIRRQSDGVIVATWSSFVDATADSQS